MSEIDKLAARLTERGYRFIPMCAPIKLTPGLWDDVINGRWSLISPVDILLLSFVMVFPGSTRLSAEQFTAEDAFRMIGAPVGGENPSPTDPIIPNQEG